MWNISPQEPISNIKEDIVNELCTLVQDSSPLVYLAIADKGNLERLATKYKTALAILVYITIGDRGNLKGLATEYVI